MEAGRPPIRHTAGRVSATTVRLPTSHRGESCHHLRLTNEEAAGLPTLKSYVRGRPTGGKQRFSERTILPPRERLETSVVVPSGRECYWHSRVGARDAATPPAVPRTPSSNRMIPSKGPWCQSRGLWMQQYNREYLKQRLALKACSARTSRQQAIPNEALI